ncbi:MAG: hypothetical protein KF789_14365 [Bdellovibrionaceae bacterium]|nr:hypothetical protein [Pseudobdellovibrionaceae bacterium]
MAKTFILLVSMFASSAFAATVGDSYECRNQEIGLVARHQIGGNVLHGFSDGQEFSMKCIPFSAGNFPQKRLDFFKDKGLKNIVDHCGMMGNYAYVGLISQSGKQIALNVFVFNFEGDFIGEQSATCQKLK